MSIFTSISHKYSLRIFLKRLFKSTTTQKHSRHSTDTVPEFHAEAPHATVSEGLAQGLYVVARAGVEPTTLRTKGVESINAPPRPTTIMSTLTAHCRWEDSATKTMTGHPPSYVLAKNQIKISVPWRCRARITFRGLTLREFAWNPAVFSYSFRLL